MDPETEMGPETKAGPETEFVNAWAIGYRWGMRHPSWLLLPVKDLLHRLADCVDCLDQEGCLEKESEQFGWLRGVLAGIQDAKEEPRPMAGGQHDGS